jgi:hypothetical protein
MIDEGTQDTMDMMLKITPSKFKQGNKIELRQEHSHQTLYDILCNHLCLNQKVIDNKQAYYNISGFMPK